MNYWNEGLKRANQWTMKEQMYSYHKGSIVVALLNVCIIKPITASLAALLLNKSNLKSTIFWDIMPCSLLKVNWHFGGTYCLHLRGRRISQARNQRESRWQAEPLVATSLFFNPEDVGNMFLQNVGWRSTDYMALYPRR
jgi:hypothetical protein